MVFLSGLETNGVVMPIDKIMGTARGSVVAPAGCGKTHLITEIAKTLQEKPYLILTHTTAGVAALKKKLREQGVPNSNYSVYTIDGWAMGVAQRFPIGCPIKSVQTDGNSFYPEVRRVVHQFLAGGHVDEIIRSTYSRLFVDEYQDTDFDQHNIVIALSGLMPTIVLGDPMQSIFNFNVSLPTWSEIQTVFPEIVALNTPWRWNNSRNHNLGTWILNVRNTLWQGGTVNLQSCPDNVFWHQLTGNARQDQINKIRVQFEVRNKMADNETLLVIGSSKNANSRHEFAKCSNGINVVEPVDLKFLDLAAAVFDNKSGASLVEQSAEIASTLMTGTEKIQLMKRVGAILSGRARTAPSHVESAACSLINQHSRQSLLKLWEAFAKKEGTRLFRGPAYSALMATLRLAEADNTRSYADCASIIREQRRHYGDRRIPARAVGSTLLLKGLEADHVLILDAGDMNKQNLYVALSRGAKTVTVFSQNNIVGA